MKELYHETGNCETVIFKSMESMGFTLSQVLYVEGDYSEAPNQFILKNFENIFDACKKLNFNFVYLPIIYEGFSDQSVWKYLVSYFHPHLRSKIQPLSIDDIQPYIPDQSLLLRSKVRQYFDSLGYKDEIRPGLLSLVNESETESYTFEYFIFDLSEKVDFAMQIEDYLMRLYSAFADNERIEDDNKSGFTFKQKRTRDILFKDDLYEDLVTSMFKNKDVGDSPPISLSRLCALSIEKNSIKNSLEETIKKLTKDLKGVGLYDDTIRALVEKLVEKIVDELKNDLILSRLIIDSNYKITLPDYGSIEIDFPPLPKSFYILFLRHPEGIFLSHLSDYMPELLVIYTIVSGHHTSHFTFGLHPLKPDPDVINNMEDMLRSIELLCSKVDNSRYEKISVIRNAFTAKEMAAVYADHYIITGKKGKEYKIQLDSKKLILPIDIENLDKPIGLRTRLDEQKKAWGTLTENYKELISLIREVLKINNNWRDNDSWEERIKKYKELINEIPGNFRVDSRTLEEKIQYYKPIIIQYFQSQKQSANKSANQTNNQ